MMIIVAGGIAPEEGRSYPSREAIERLTVWFAKYLASAPDEGPHRITSFHVVGTYPQTEVVSGILANWMRAKGWERYRVPMETFSYGASAYTLTNYLALRDADSTTRVCTLDGDDELVDLITRAAQRGLHINAQADLWRGNRAVRRAKEGMRH